MRLRAAALNQSPEGSTLAARFEREALDDLLGLLGVLPTPEPTSPPATRLRFRAYVVESAVGQAAEVPIVAEGIPQIGLGSFRVRARWSPQALRLTEVTWDVGEGALFRDDPGGTVELALPPAPTGPSGTKVLARLGFEVIGTEFGAAGYVPGDEVARLEQAVFGALDRLRLGDPPLAADLLTAAYADLADGAARPGSLHERLDSEGLAEPVMERLLNAIDLASQPADADAMVASLEVLRATLGNALAAYRHRIASMATIPVTLEVLEVLDTRGEPLPTLPPAYGGVLTEAVPAAAEPVPTVDMESSSGAAQAVPPATEPRPGAVVAPAGERPGPPMPRAVVSALLLAGLLGVLAMLWSDRGAVSGRTV
jgi:hypothetical protein